MKSPMFHVLPYTGPTTTLQSFNAVTSIVYFSKYACFIFSPKRVASIFLTTPLMRKSSRRNGLYASFVALQSRRTKQHICQRMYIAQSQASVSVPVYVRQYTQNKRSPEERRSQRHLCQRSWASACHVCLPWCERRLRMRSDNSRPMFARNTQCNFNMLTQWRLILLALTFVGACLRCCSLRHDKTVAYTYRRSRPCTILCSIT